MLKNYIRIAWRNLQKSRTSSFINIAGLATGMAIALIIGLWIYDELSFDHYHTRHSHIARGMVTQITPDETATDPTVSMPMGQAFKTQYSDLFTSVAHMSIPYDQLVAYDDKKLMANSAWADKELPEMFTFRMLKGSIAAAADPSTVLIAQSLATSLFGSADPINRSILIGNNLQFNIGGVYEDLPKNTTLADLKVIMPWYNKENAYRNKNTNWDDHNGSIFVELAPGVTAEQATARIKSLPTAQIKGWKEEALVYPLDKAHLYSKFTNGKPDGGRIQFIWLFGIIGSFVLLLACINFMNLSTARSEKRAKEVGIRKTVGSLKRQLIAQFLSESLLITLLSFLLSIVLVEISLPFFNSISAKEMTMPWNNSWFWALSMGFVLFTGILAGSYPAFYLSRFDPVQVLKGTFKTGRYASTPRQVLVVLQFTVSLTLIIGTIIVFKQISYVKGLAVGYDRDGLISVPMNTADIYNHFNALQAEIKEQQLASSVARSSMKPTGFRNNNQLYWRGKRPDQESVFFRNVNVSREYGATVKWQITQGRDFSIDYPSDSASLILNEAAAKVIGIKNPIGENMTIFDTKFTVIGVVKDMITNSPYEKIQPAVFLGFPYYDYIIIRLRPGQQTSKTLAGLESIFKKYNPGSPFLYNFIDDEYARKFETEQRIGHLASVFASLAIFISCIGLFGLASFVAEQRTKEIGVRKVLGAGIFTLWGLLSRDFLKLVVISFCIAMPLAWYAMHTWLQNYEHRTDIPWWIFAASGIGLLLITLLTVSFQSLRAATMSPVKSLRTE
ncbi:MAG TPA: ABC transporter permease [Puia sp.]|nr:ABC transporter permease [Puia sp.]